MLQGHGAVEMPLFSRMGGYKVNGDKQMLSVETETSIFLSDTRSWGPQSEQRCPGSSGRIPSHSSGSWVENRGRRFVDADPMCCKLLQC